MEKERFLELTRNFSSLNAEEAAELDRLQRAFPYSQILHALATRSAQDNQLDTSNKMLHLSAVYATDRGVLKSIMTTPRASRVAAEVVMEEAPVETTAIAISDDGNGSIEFSGSSTLSGDALITEVMNDLARLKELKQNFEDSFMQVTTLHPPGEFGAIKVPEARPVTKTESSTPRKVTTRPPAHSKPTDDLIPEPSGEMLLEEIKTKKPVEPESPRQKQQSEIIDQFIRKQPTIPKGPAPGTDPADLSETTSSLTDNLVSETLVEILLRQGKKDKAIEILRKLIWKFPQKKAIFAAQIEELRK